VGGSPATSSVVANPGLDAEFGEGYESGVFNVKRKFLLNSLGVPLDDYLPGAKKYPNLTGALV
jgi:hypothetical protein